MGGVYLEVGAPVTRKPRQAHWGGCAGHTQEKPLAWVLRPSRPHAGALFPSPHLEMGFFVPSVVCPRQFTGPGARVL